MMRTTGDISNKEINQTKGHHWNVNSNIQKILAINLMSKIDLKNIIIWWRIYLKKCEY